jgi:uncharacterized protein (TIGR03435 family)
MKQIVAATACIAFLVLTASAQDTTGTPAFEVASVKRADTQNQRPMPPMSGPITEMMGFEGGPGSKDPGRINYRGVTLKSLLARAYQVKPDQIAGPGWLALERYTIEAKLPPATDAEQLRVMLQKLLVERFQISMHHEVKQTPVYRLKVAKNGPKLKPAEELPQYASDEERQAANMKRLQESMAKRQAAMEAYTRQGLRPPNSSSFRYAKATTQRLADALSSHVGRPVKDMTGLEGDYSFQLEWDPSAGQREDAGVSIFTALQEQLGLRLESGDDEIEFLMIEKAEKIPISN